MTLRVEDKPRIIVERSPWVSFFETLQEELYQWRGMAQRMRFDKAKLQFTAEEAEKDRQFKEASLEKDRQFKESALYKKDMFDKENLIIKDILESEDEAADFGLNVEEPMSRLQSQFLNGAGQDLKNLTKEIKQKRYSNLLDIRSDIKDQKRLFNEGQQLSSTIDSQIKKDGIATAEEFDLYQQGVRDYMNDPQYEVPEALKKGVMFNLNDPQSRLQRLQLEGEKTRQVQLETEATRAKIMHEKALSKFDLDLATLYRDDNITSISGKQSSADYQLSSAIHQQFKGMTKLEIMEMVENSTVTYEDQVPGELDYSDIAAIEPQMREYMSFYLQQRPDAQEFLGISQEDFDAVDPSVDTGDLEPSDNFNFAIQEGVRNALTGLEQNPNYEFKTPFIVTQAKAAEFQAQQKATVDLERSFAATIPTLQNYFKDPATGQISETIVESIAKDLLDDEDFLKRAMSRHGGKGLSSARVYVESLMAPLLAQADPTTVNLLISENEDIEKIMDSAGFTGMTEVIKAARSAKGAVESRYTPETRLSKPERQRLERVSRETNTYIEKITNKYEKELASLNLIGEDLIKQGYDPSTWHASNSIQTKTLELQQLSLELVDTTDDSEIADLKAQIEILMGEIDALR